MYSNSHIIYERSNNIKIIKNLNKSLQNVSPKGEYSLTQNFFDPSKSSPPNDFMKKLQMRMSIYNSTSFQINHDNCEIE